MECYSVAQNEIKGRLDPFYYKPEFISIEKALGKLLFKKIKEISPELKNGSTPSGGIFLKKGVPYFRSQDFHLFDFEINQFISPEFHQSLARSSIKGGDVLVAVVGATLGVIGYVPDTIKEGNINQNVARIRVIDKSISPKYLAIFLSSAIGQKMLLRNATITTQAYLNNEQLGEIKIPAISSEKQNKVIDFIESAYEQKKQKENEAQKLLDSIDDYVLDELGIKLPELKDKKCYAVDSNDIQNRLDPSYYQPKFSEIEKAFKKSDIKLESLKNFITKIHYGVSIKNIYIDEGIPLIRICNLWPNKIDLSDVIKLPESMRKEIGNGFVYEGDILISRSGSVGIVSVVPKEADGLAFGSFMIKFCLNDKINKEYVSIWLNNKLATLFTQREKIGAIQGNITIPTIENFKIPIPSLSTQNKISDEVKKRMAKADKLRKEAENILAQAKEKFENIILGKK